jgi:transcriptional regulator of acetoin/glycerol metabolism
MYGGGLIMKANDSIAKCTEASVSFRNQIKNMKDAWEKFISTGDTNLTPSVRPEILNSWKRSYKTGVNPYEFPLKHPDYCLTHTDLEERLEINKILIDAATPFMDIIVSNMGGTVSRIDLYDKDLYLLKQFGKPENMQKSIFATTGVTRSENLIGTNAIALSYILRRPIQVTGPEHFNEQFHNVTCSSSPLFTKSGEIPGVLNIISSIDNLQEHTLGIAVALSKNIELGLAQYNSYRYIENIVIPINENIYYQLRSLFCSLNVTNRTVAD